MIIHSPIGDLRVFVEEERVVEVLLPGWRSGLTPTAKQNIAYADKVQRAFYDYFEADGKKETASAHKELVRICLPKGDVLDVTPFHRLVYTALLEQVPSGTTATYGELAALAQSPLAARAVGTAMRKNSLPIIVPCHRVLATNGLGGYMGNGEEGERMKRWLLSHEGATY